MWGRGSRLSLKARFDLPNRFVTRLAWREATRLLYALVGPASRIRFNGVSVAGLRRLRTVRELVHCRGLRKGTLVPVGAQDLHLGTHHRQACSDAFVFFRDPVGRSVDHALANESLKLFIAAQAQHFFAATGRVSLPEIEQDNVEQRFEFKRSPARQDRYQLLANVIGHTTRESSSGF
jgi:hypothetical protein